MKLTEADMTLPVLRLLAAAPGGTMPMAQIKSELEPVLTFSAEDLAPSNSRPPEPTWRQIVGNITSHHAVGGNIIHEGLVEYISKMEGLKITGLGLAYLKKHGG
jgi:hypothetical protein